MKQRLVRLVTGRFSGVAVVLAIIGVLVTTRVLFHDLAVAVQVADSAVALAAAGAVSVLWVAARRRDAANPNLGRLLEVAAEQERQRRRLDDPDTLHVGNPMLAIRWTSLRHITSNASGSVAPQIIRSTGRFSGTADEISAQLADGYTRLTSDQRLLIVGKPGSGKSTLARLLCLGLLESRKPGEPVPVLVPLALWEPTDNLLSWVVESVVADMGGPDPLHVRALLDQRLLIPVLDGLDEMAESLRGQFVQSVNVALAGRPLIVTCRSTEYQELFVANGLDLLLNTTLTINGVQERALMTYSKEIDPSHRSEWQALSNEVERNPRGPVAIAFTTPLMIRLAVDTYRQRGNPAELLDQQRFPDAQHIAGYLLDASISAAYAPETPSGARQRHSRWSAGQARAWLAFLAAYQDARSERETSWWRLSASVTPIALVPILLVAAGVLVMLLSDILQHLPTLTRTAGLALFGFAALVGVVWTYRPRPQPRTLSLSFSTIRRAFAIHLLIPPGILLVLALVLQVEPLLSEGIDSLTVAAVLAAARDLSGALAIGLVISVGYLIHAVMSPPDTPVAPQLGPDGSLRRDRLASWVAPVTAGLVSAVILIPLIRLALILGIAAAGAVTSWPGWPGERHLLGPPWDQEVGGLWDTLLDPGLEFPALAGLGIATATLMLHPWPRLCVARPFMALQRKLPLRLMTFLDDTYQRGLLHRSGANYAFRHRSLQEHLASDPRARRAVGFVVAHAGERNGGSRRGRVVVAGGAVLCAFVLALMPLLPKNTATEVLPLSFKSSGDVMRTSPDGKIADVSFSSAFGQRWDLEHAVPLGEPFSADAWTVDPTNESLVAMTSLADRYPDRLLTSSTRYPKTLHPLGPDDKGIQIWNHLGEQLGQDIGPVADAFLSPTGHALLTVQKSTDTVTLWNTDTGDLIGQPHNGFQAAVFSNDGRRIYLLSAAGDHLASWDYGADSPAVGEPSRTSATGDGSLEVNLQHGIGSLEQSGQELVAVGDVVVQADAKVLSDVPGHDPGKARTVRIWDAHDEREITPKSGIAADNVRLSPSGISMITLRYSDAIIRGDYEGDESIWAMQLWDTRKVVVRGQTDLRVLDARYLSDERVVVQNARDASYRLINSGSGGPIGEPFGAGLQLVDLPGPAFAVAPNGTDWFGNLTEIPAGIGLAGSGSADSSDPSLIYDLEGHILGEIRGGEFTVAPAGSVMVVASDEALPALVAYGSSGVRKIINISISGNYHFSADGRLLGITLGPEAWVLDTVRGLWVAHLVGHLKDISDVTFSEDDDLVVTSAQDYTMRVWSVRRSFG